MNSFMGINTFCCCCCCCCCCSWQLTIACFKFCRKLFGTVKLNYLRRHKIRCINEHKLSPKNECTQNHVCETNASRPSIYDDWPDRMSRQKQYMRTLGIQFCPLLRIRESARRFSNEYSSFDFPARVLEFASQPQTGYKRPTAPYWCKKLAHRSPLSRQYVRCNCS